MYTHLKSVFGKYILFTRSYNNGFIYIFKIVYNGIGNKNDEIYKKIKMLCKFILIN